MSKRLQVLLEPREYSQFQKMAVRAGLSLGEWVRQILRKAAGRAPQKEASAKLKNIRKAAACGYPTGDIEQILSEIEKGRLEQ